MLRDPTRLYGGTIPPEKERAAKIISAFTQPPVISIPVFMLLNTEAAGLGGWLLYTLICIVFAIVLPMVFISYFAKRYGNDDGDIVRREDRYVMLALGAVFYLLGTVCLYLADAPEITTVLMLCYLVVTVAVLLITFYWKISLHSIGLMGPSMALFVTFGLPGLALLLLYPPVLWARYYLKKHTPLQLALAPAVGFAITYAIFLLLL
ncbi:hypothetical protein TALC_00764 [Thermoplasmatales archaeon BRNA1]|nr:hypothetical protein TALC_00764 [Thermoplasmatales archaeon BRNA1]